MKDAIKKEYNCLTLESLPLCVDLDGTLIRTDTLQETILKFLWQWPHKVFHLAWWLIKGRAFLKQKLAQYIDLQLYELPVNEEFLDWLRSEKNIGRKLILVTASDEKPAKAIADALGIFDETLASDGQTNLRAHAKAEALIKRYGQDKFVYAGNSKDDLKVWASSAEIIAVNTPQNILKQAQLSGKPLQIFNEGICKLKLLHAFSRPHLLISTLPVMASFLLLRHSLKLHIIFLISGYILGLGTTLLSDLLRMRIMPVGSETAIFKALQKGYIPIASALYMVALLLGFGIFASSLLPNNCLWGLYLIVTVWLFYSTYLPTSFMTRLTVIFFLLSSIFCSCIAFL